MNIGLTELIVILIVALLVIGPKKLPDVAQALGRGLAEFKRAMEDVKDELKMEEVKRDIDDMKDSLLRKGLEEEKVTATHSGEDGHETHPPQSTLPGGQKPSAEGS
ncbi:MAG: twin-arginine translocase subunit TatB [Syntrophobacterales bacterium]|jgi:Tat protein translocase TatB subunit|nr:twin-arginine translocase subunit TatB [Syntrophobacterales bacterium]